MLRQRMRYESRLQVIHFLFSIANADGRVSPMEAQEINRIASFMGIQSRDLESIKAMFFKNPDSAYKILEIERTATISEIKRPIGKWLKNTIPTSFNTWKKFTKKEPQINLEKSRKLRTTAKRKGFLSKEDPFPANKNALKYLFTQQLGGEHPGKVE